MPDSKSSSLSGAKGDSTIVFAYIKVLKTRKRRFFVLKSVHKASPWEFEGSKRPLDYYLSMYKNEKSYQKNEPKHVYNLESVILLSKCTKRDNNTVLGICFQEDALFLKFTSEDELNRWYFHLSEIYSVKRNCRWPELLYCFSVNLKQKDLASASVKHGRPDLAGKYRLCITESEVLLVRDNLLCPALCLPLQSIRSTGPSDSATFQLNLGRLSPIGEGVLHFEVEQNCKPKEITETLMRCFSESSNRRLADSRTYNNKNEIQRRSKNTVHRSGSFETALHHDRDPSYSEREPNRVHSNFSDGQRTHSQPLNKSFDDYCDLSKDVQPTAATSRSLNSSVSLSGNSEMTVLDGPSTALQRPQQQQYQQQYIVGSEESRSSRVRNWRFDSVEACSPALGYRANSIGSRPTSSRQGSYMPSSYSVPPSYCADATYTGGGHRDDRQVFVELNFTRPRTTSDAARYRQVGGQRFRQRTGSYGNRNAHRLGAQPDDIAGASGGVLGEVGPPGTELQSLREAVCTKEDDAYVPMSFGGQSKSQLQNQATSWMPTDEHEEEEDPYWVNPSSLDRLCDPAMT